MKKQLLTMLLLMVGMTSLAQSGWSDPSGNYQEQTVVYVTVDCGDYDIYSGVTEPQVAAFIGGEIRALATSYQSLGNYKVYAMRVGGESTDNGSVVDFKLYDPVSGLVYPLEMTDEQYEAAEITYQGDYTYQEDQSIKLFIGSATPANEMRFTYYDVEHGSIFMNVGDVMTIEDGGSLEYLFVSPTNGEEIPATTPEATLEWDLSLMDNSGNPASHYVSIKENVITALNSTPYGINVTARAGSLEMQVNIFVYQPVTEIAIADAEIYLGADGFAPEVVYNGGESEPTTPGVTLTVDNVDVVRIDGGTTIVPVAKGAVTVTAVADDNPEVTTTFQVNVLSALQEFTYKGEIEFTIYDENSKDMMGSVNPPIFHWVIDENSGAPVVEPNEEYTIASEDESVVRVEYDDTGTKLVAVTAVKKGETNLVFTSKYDPTMSVTVRTVIKQAVYGVNFLTVNGENVSGAETRPMADVYVNETVTVVAELNPADADYTDFSFRFVTSDGMEIPTETIGVEVAGTKISGGQCIMDFVFNTIPGVEVCIEAQADGVRSDNVLLNVYNRVENIDVSLLDEYWIDSDGDIFDFKYAVAPGNVKNEEFTVESSNPGVAEIIKSLEAGVYQLHAYAPGEVTFTFKSDENPDVAVEYSTVIKRTPTGVKITSIAGQEPSPNGMTIAVGQTIEAVAAVEPGDATIELFVMSIVNGDGMPIGEAEVEIDKVALNDAKTECSITFRFITVPQDRVFVKAAVNETITDQVPLFVVQSVNEIQLSETEKTIWFGNEQIDFSITAIALPEDATNKNITVEVDDNVIVEYLGVGEATGMHNFRTMNKGTATITFTSEDNPSVVAKCVVNVKRKVNEISFDGFNGPLYNDGVAREVALTFWPEDADFDASALSVRVETTQFSFPGHWSVVEVEQGEVSGNSVAFEFTPKALCQNSNVIFEYDAAAVEGGSEMLTTSGMVSVMEKLTLNGGWSWISLTSAMFAPEAIKDGFVEARSRTDLVFNDVKWGLFGSLTMFDQSQAYKIKMLDDIDPVTVYADLEGVMSYDGAIESKEFIKGWNWVSYPYEYRYPVEEIFNAANFAEGDIILSKNDGFVTLTDGAWVGTLSDLLPNEGYMIYTAKAFTCDMPNRFSLEQGEFEASAGTEIPAPAGVAARERSVWNYDGSRFANSMAVIAKVDVEECEDYTIGAFVGDECRGEGRFINGLAFISVAGEADENVTFRLYNKVTGEFIDLDRELQFAGMAGSVKAPVTMGTIEGTTGIDEITDNRVQSTVIYDLSGRKVENMTEGIYVIKVREGDKIVTKKVRK
ncbi:MAG: T9SS type A sorting domain-containing protein [Bacteroidaceae bacterium]|nr:T9SS type A sorting domain-containing protein [Bacteroidaceae bacterium]